MRAGIVRALRARHIDVTTAWEAQLTGRPDEEHLAYATAQGRVVFTFNRGDFAQLHKMYLARGRHHAGIILSDQLETGVIVLSDQLETGVIVRRLLRLLADRSATDMRDWLEYLSNWR